MSLNAVRSFSSTTKKNLLKLIGKVTLEDVRTLNSPDGERWVSSVHKIRDEVEALVRTIYLFRRYTVLTLVSMTMLPNMKSSEHTSFHRNLFLYVKINA